MHRIIIADTSCLILYSKIQLIHILHSLYSDVIITPEVASEFGESILEWINIKLAKPEKIAKSYNLDVTGSLGIIVKAKEKNIISSVRDVLVKIRATIFHLPSSLEKLILKIAEE